MNDSLKFWQLREWLTLHEAACFICGEDPSINYSTFADELLALKEAGANYVIGSPNDNYDPIYRALREAVELDIEEEFLTDRNVEELLPIMDEQAQNLVEDYSKVFSSLIFKNSNVKGYNLSHAKDFEINNINRAQIKVSAIKQWLIKKNLKPGFFFPEETEQQEETIQYQQPIYQTRLMEIMYKTIERYYGVNYDPEDTDSTTKQKIIIDWLKETYDLSGAQAKAIDILTRPRP